MPKSKKETPICDKCVEVHGRDTKNPIKCPYCDEIIGCFWHKKGLDHMQTCPKKDQPITDPDSLQQAKKAQAKARNDKEKEETKVEDKLNQKQERFCQLYATDREFFGNGVQTYIEVYDPDQSKPNWYKTACAVASEILSNPKVFNRINEILEETGMNDVAVDKQLLFLIHQQADFSNKMAAIREYNKLKKRITDKLDLTSGGLPIQVVSYEKVIKKDE